MTGSRVRLQSCFQRMGTEGCTCAGRVLWLSRALISAWPLHHSSNGQSSPRRLKGAGGEGVCAVLTMISGISVRIDGTGRRTDGG